MTSKTRQTFDFVIEQKTILLPMLIDHVYAYGLLMWPSGLRKKFFEDEDPVIHFGPPGYALGGSGRKITTLMRNHEYFIPIKFHQCPSSGSEREVENIKTFTPVGQHSMTIALLSLQLR